MALKNYMQKTREITLEQRLADRIKQTRLTPTHTEINFDLLGSGYTMKKATASKILKLYHQHADKRSTCMCGAYTTGHFVIPNAKVTSFIEQLTAILTNTANLKPYAPENEGT